MTLKTIKNTNTMTQLEAERALKETFDARIDYINNDNFNLYFIISGKGVYAMAMIHKDTRYCQLIDPFSHKTIKSLTI